MSNFRLSFIICIIFGVTTPAIADRVGDKPVCESTGELIKLSGSKYVCVSIADAIKIKQESGNTAGILKVTTELAEAGDRLSQRALGQFYAKGEFVPLDLKKSVSWYRLAAEQGDSEAQYRMGQAYLKGEGVPSLVIPFAEHWYKLAAENGDVRAMVNLGFLADGRKNYSVAFGWYQKAAELNDPMSQLYVGRAYHRGLGTSIDVEQAVKWYRKAADQGDANAKLWLTLMNFGAVQ